MEKKFYLASATSPLQEIGMRAQVVSFLIAQGIKEGNAVNDPADKKKVIVALRADNENRIKEVKADLVKHLNELHKNDFCYDKFPHDITSGDLYELNNPHPLMVIPLNDLASSLMLEQTSKGAGAMKHMATSMDALVHLLGPLPQILEKLAAKLS